MVLYRLLLTLLSPVLLLALGWRVLRRYETRIDFAQRLGLGAGQSGAIWVHGASNGELTSARKLIEALAMNYDNSPVLVTSNSISGRQLVERWKLQNVSARLAPLDLRICIGACLRNWQPRLLIVLENELWPNRLEMLSCPVMCVAARMSERSENLWKKVPGLAKRILRNIAYLAPQDRASGRRFLQLGLRAEALSQEIVLKTDVELSPPNPAELQSLRAFFPADQTWLAASTHEGEEEIVLNALAKASKPQKLILAIRHPHRAKDVRALIEKRGFTISQRSLGETPKSEVYLADSLGEMALWYSLAGVTFVGGSLVNVGGHTPYEPTAWGSAVLHGPYTSSFASIYEALDTNGGARLVRTSEEIADVVEDLLQPDARRPVLQSASNVIASAKSSWAGKGQVLDVVAKLI